MAEAHKIAIAALSENEVAQAQLLMAQSVVEVMRNPDSGHEERFRTIGTYLITSAMATEYLESMGTQEVFVGTLIFAGAHPEGAVKLGEFAMQRDVRRQVFSLRYLGDATGKGIERTKRSVSLNEPEFIRSIIEERGAA